MHKKKFKKPTLEQVKTIHFLLLKAEGQQYLALPSVKEPLIESILDGIDQHVYGMELYPTICDKAIHILNNIQAAQAFPDGNKRVALASFEMFLNLNGSSLSDISQKQKLFFVLALANHNIDKESAVNCCIKGLRK